MNGNEKAPSGVGTPNEARTETGGVLVSCTKHTTGQARAQGKIERLLKVGEQNAIKSRDLICLAGLKNERNLRDAIAAERASGALILSTNRAPFGYYLPAPGEQGRREIESFIKTVHARACNTQLALRAARRALRQIDGQLEMEACDDGR